MHLDKKKVCGINKITPFTGFGLTLLLLQSTSLFGAKWMYLYHVAGYQNGSTQLIFFWLLTDNLEKIDRDFWIYQIGGG